MPRSRTHALALALLAACSWGAAPAYAQVPEVLWTFDQSPISGAFVATGADGTIYSADDDRLWALDPLGAVAWTFDPAGGAGGLSVSGGGRPVDFLADGRVVVGAGHTIWALEPDGTVSWSYTWSGGFNNQIDNGPSVGPDGNIYATTAVNDGEGLGAFSLTPDGQLRWAEDAEPSLVILNASHGQRVVFTQDRALFGFVQTTGAPFVYAFDFDGGATNLVNSCTSSPRTNGVDRVLFASGCGVQSYDPGSSSVEWTVGLGSVHALPIADASGVVYSGSWLGAASAIGPNGQVLWTSASVGMQRALTVSEPYGLFLYGGGAPGQPNWFGAIEAATGADLWQVPFDTVGTHSELLFSNEAALSPDGSVAYFTTRFTSNGAPGRLWAVRVGEDSGGAVSYCTAGVSASGCQATLSASGAASATAPAGFELQADGVEGNKTGLFYYGTSGRQANPWGNGTSLQCVVPPLTRLGQLAASGTNGACDGTFVQDLNALWCPTCPKPAKNPGAGAVLQAQFWYRDPLNTSNQTTSFSDAVELTVAP